jgi:hypothetical protein
VLPSAEELVLYQKRPNKDSSSRCQKMLSDFLMLETAKSSSLEGFSLNISLPLVAIFKLSSTV